MRSFFPPYRFYGRRMLRVHAGRSSSSDSSEPSSEYSSSDRSSDSDDDDRGEYREGYFDGEKRPHCEGRGDKYCAKWWKRDCPSECERVCKQVDDDDDDDDGDTYKGIRSDLKNALKDKLFDQVFIEGNEFCVANCKGGRGGKCRDWDKDDGEKWCKGIKCPKRGIDGCHNGKDFVPRLRLVGVN